MRLLYGVHTQGQGGLARLQALLPEFRKLGAEVYIISSGQVPPACYHFEGHSHFPGLEYCLDQGQVNYLKTFLRWGRMVPSILKSVRDVQQIINRFRPDLILTDFEPLTGSALLRPGCEVIATSRPATLIDSNVQVPDGMELEKRMARTVIRLFCMGAHRRRGYHLAPESYRCLPPVIDPAVRLIKHSEGQHLFIYNVYHPGFSGRDVVAWSKRTQKPVVAYGFPEMPRGRQGLVNFRPAARELFLHDLATCRAAITTAGLATPLEAWWYQKPCAVVPIPRQWEQFVNAHHVAAAGVGTIQMDWNLDRAYAADLPRAQSASEWLLETPERIARRIFVDAGMALPVPHVQRIAA